MTEKLSNNAAINIRPMTESDLDEHVAVWLQDAEVAKRFVKDKPLAAVITKYRERIRGETDPNIRVLCVTLDEEPAFLVQAYRLGDYPEDRDSVVAAQKLRSVADEDMVDDQTVGIDYFMNPALRGQGYGTRILHEVAATAIPGVFEGATRVVADPDSDNPASIGALLKAGFIDDGVVMTSTDEDGATHEARLLVYTITN